MTSLTRGAVEPLGVKPRDAERSKNFFALGPGVVDVHPPGRRDARAGSRRKFSNKPQVPRRQHRRVQGGPRLRRDRRAVRPPLRDRSRRCCRPGTYTNITGNTALAWGLIAAAQLSRAAAVPRVVPDHAGVRHPPRAVQAQELRRAHAAGRGRDRRHRRGHRRRLRRAPRRHHDERPGHGAEGARRWGWRSASSCRC